jgi:nucleotide-binding universal stress UspA family protein
MAGTTVRIPTSVTETARRPQLQRILLATDFSECSKNALRCALGIVRRYSSKLYVLNAVHSIGYLLAGGSALADAAVEARRDARRLERELIRDGSLVGVEHEFIVLEGRPVDVILEVAAAKNIDLIVLGTHGRHGLTKMLLGSCAEGVFRSLVCPVLTVGGWLGRFWPTGAGPQRILLLTDFSVTANPAADHAFSIACRCGADLIVRYVPEERSKATSKPRREAEDVSQEYRNWLDGINNRKFTPQLRAQGAATAEAIIHEAHEVGADLIVMGVGGKSTQHPKCALAYKIVSESECPVLTVPAENRNGRHGIRVKEHGDL